jgi:hypothetical protein
VNYSASLYFLADLVRQHKFLTVPDRGSEREQTTGGVHAKCFGFLPEGFSLNCVSMNHHRQADQEALAGSTFRHRIAAGLHIFTVGAARPIFLGFL